ncbi:MAG TPA: cytochrome C biogenesis protein [Bacteroidetes bacterium]|nr:cytochrome C biogenesis protein [Bacteroidota bacterium]
MDSLFTALTEAMQGAFALAMLAAFGWGVMSILLSPCHLSSIPLIVGFLTARKEIEPRQALRLSLFFAVGILVTIAVIGLITAALGRLMGDIGLYGNFVVAAIFLLFGLHLMDVIRIPDLGIQVRPLRVRSPLLSALGLGLMFGFALGPCTFAFLAPVLGVVFQISSSNPVSAGMLLLSFGLGHCGVIVAAGGIASRVQSYLEWTNRSNVVLWIKRASGILVVFAGIYSLLQ